MIGKRKRKVSECMHRKGKETPGYGFESGKLPKCKFSIKRHDSLPGWLVAESCIRLPGVSIPRLS